MTTDVDLVERALPHNLEAERAVLGACLIRHDAIDEVLGVLEPAHFYRDAHRRIWSQMRRLALRRVMTDLVTVKEALSTAQELDEIGGPVYLASLVDGVPRSTNVASYAGIVRQKAQLRATIAAATRLLERAYQADSDAAEVINEAERALCEIATNADRGGFRRLSDILPKVLDQVDAWTRTPGGITGLRTGLRDLDAMTRGLQPGNLVIVAARPSMGKSALVQGIERAVAGAGQTVGAFSLEMSADEHAIRAVTSEGRIDGHRLQRGRLSEAEYGRFAMALGTLDTYPLFVDDSPFLTVFDIRSRARRLKAEHGLSLLTVDYAQLIESHERRENRNLELSTITRTLKAIAKELQIPVIALSQLSRDLEKRIDKRPQMSDLRESGALEQDADVIVFIYRPVRYDPAPKCDFANMAPADYEQYAELIIGKQRNGPVGTIPARWTAEHTTFSDWNTDDARQQPLPTEVA